MKITVYCTDLKKDDITYLKTIGCGSAKVRTSIYEDSAMLVATGSFNDLVEIIMQVTCLKNYKVRLQ